MGPCTRPQLNPDRRHLTHYCSMTMITVLIPAYNQSHYLGQAIQSALKQTYQDIEVIVVDDASTDDTRAVVHGSSEPRVRHVV